MNQQSDPSRLLIVEEALRSLKGHWPEYIRTIAGACRRANDDVTILAHKQACPEIVTKLQAEPVLPYSAWDGIYRSSNPAVRYYGALLHNLRLYRCMTDFFEKTEKFECVLAPTILIHHLLAWSQLARRFAGTKFDRLVLIIINGQGIYQGPGRPVLFPRHPKRTIFRLALKSLAPLVKSGHVVLGSETDRLAREYESFCGIPFHRFPHPVDFPDAPQSTGNSGALVFSCFGFARHEKGSDLLQEAILRARQKRPDLNVRFVIQWLDDFKDPAGRLVTKDPRLLADPCVEFITEPIDTAGYLDKLGQTSATLLPYRASSYYSRVSRVAIEAAIVGVPILYTRHTWLEDLVERCGAGLAFEDENVADLTDKILEMADNITSLKAQAGDRAGLARSIHAPAAFREELLASGRTTQKPTPASNIGYSPLNA